jgi:hypothetical protein
MRSDEGEHDAVGREVGEADLLGEADQERADRGACDRAHAADDDDDERGEQIAHVLARRDGERRAADDAGEAGEACADREHDHEHHMHVDASRRQHAAIVDAGADHHADARAVQHEPERDPDRDCRHEHHQAVERIGHGHGVAVRAEGEHDRRAHRAVEPFRRDELVGFSRPDREHQVGRDDRDADRHQRLAQFLAFHVPEDEHLHHRARRGGGEEAGGDAEQPIAGAVRHLVSDIGAEQEQRAVREVDVAHQPEDQRKTARDEEVETGERHSVEDGGDEELLLADQPGQPFRPHRQEQPEHQRC